jgi:hypothetical protein
MRAPSQAAQDGRFLLTTLWQLAFNDWQQSFFLNGSTELKEELEILQLLGQIRALLERYEVGSWITHLADLETRFQEAIISGEDWKKQEVLDELDGLYGGMGSFNDLVIPHQPSVVISRQELVVANDELSKLRRQLHRALRKAH